MKNALTGLVVAAGLCLAGAGALAQSGDAALFETARASGKAADYAAYLGAYPDGQFAQEARNQLEILAKDIPTVAGASPLMLGRPPAGEIVVTFSAPLAIGDPRVDGRSMAQIITGTPLFSPVEGLPDEIWKDKACSDCHQWTAEALCTQAAVYQGADVGTLDQHPLGGGLKRAMAIWKDAGCPD